MTGDDWQKIGEVGAYIVMGLLVTYKAHRAEMQAKKAKEYSQPTGNGFAASVKDALACLQASATEQKIATERIEARQQQDSGMLYSHIQSHANADVFKGVHRDASSDPNSP